MMLNYLYDLKQLCTRTKRTRRFAEDNQLLGGCMFINTSTVNVHDRDPPSFTDT